MTIPFRAKQKESTTLPKQSTPRKGTETGRFCPRSFPRSETIYTPQGDGNPGSGWAGPSCWGNNLHPARGRKLLCCHDRCARPRKQSTPRKGTETDSVLSCASMGMRNNLHPARGRKRFPVTRSWKLLETIYTPQGDGNELPCPYGNNCMRNNLHPARGRKPPCTDQEFFSAYETIYTPQGDGNVFSPIMIFSHHLKQSTPRKGTETHSAYNPHCISQKQSTPRKGTETQAMFVILTFSGNNLHPARGRKPLRT